MVEVIHIPKSTKHTGDKCCIYIAPSTLHDEIIKELEGIDCYIFDPGKLEPDSILPTDPKQLKKILTWQLDNMQWADFIFVYFPSLSENEDIINGLMYQLSYFIGREETSKIVIVCEDNFWAKNYLEVMLKCYSGETRKKIHSTVKEGMIDLKKKIKRFKF